MAAALLVKLGLTRHNSAESALDAAVPAAYLHVLMGHVEPRSTSVCLTVTPSLLADASRRSEAFAVPAWTQVAR